jgi:hypothetical protein
MTQSGPPDDAGAGARPIANIGSVAGFRTGGFTCCPEPLRKTKVSTPVPIALRKKDYT